MQLQHLASVSAGADKEYCIAQSQRAYDLISKVANEIDNNMIMNSGNHSAEEKAKLEQDLKVYNTYKLDVLFTLHNLHKINNDYVKALSIAKEHTLLNQQIYKKEHKCYAYALLLEAQCMSMIPNLDQHTTLQVINEAL
jgi:metallophosphoesterase superfamily enzyme